MRQQSDAYFAIFKGVLLLNAFNNVSGDNNNGLVTPSEQNIHWLFAGSQYADEVDAALKWFNEAIERREQYASALGGAAIAQTMLHNLEEGESLYRQALLNHIDDSISFTRYYKEVQAAVMLEHRKK